MSGIETCAARAREVHWEPYRLVIPRLLNSQHASWIIERLVGRLENLSTEVLWVQRGT